MDDKNKTNKYLIIHTHMYQPPRENPFTGEVELEHSAKPYDNWNNRIAMECYLPNLYGRIYNESTKIIEILNNYEYLNFNFGPTLLNWIEIYYPFYYKKIIETVKRIKEKKGFSPAITQGYNHTILPLDNFQTRITQISWAIKDFELRFGFYPEGIWLGETAVNEDVLRILIDHRIKYVILSPDQISKAIDLKKQKEKDPHLDNLYIWFDRNEKKIKDCKRHIYVFLYDREISKKIAFDNITFNSEIFVKEINKRFTEINHNTIIIATDGETFGHHHKFADLTLSYSFKYELSKYNITPITLSQYLSMRMPEAEIELSQGPDGDGTSWSCAHGVRRWKGGCNCGDEGVYDTSWRFGLRAATNWLSEVLNDIYNEEGKNIFIDPFNARNNYIEVLRGKININDFLNQNLKINNEQAKNKAKKLLIMIKYQMFSLTSCGWFFNDISRIETQQNLKYALKAITIAEELGYKGIEKGFISLLQMAKSNFKEIANGEKLYKTYIRPSLISPELVDAFLVLKAILRETDYYQNQLYKIKILKHLEIKEDEIYSCALITNIENQEERKLHIVLNIENIKEIKIRLKYVDEIKDFSDIDREIDFSNMTKKMQLEIFKLIIIRGKQKNLSSMEKSFNMLYEIIEINKDMVYENLEDDFKHIIYQMLTVNIINFLKNPSMDYLNKISDLINKCERINFEINYKLSNDITSFFDNFTNKIFNETSPDFLILSKEVFKKLNLHPVVFHLENAIFELSREKKAMSL